MAVVVNPDRSSPIDIVLELDEFIEETNPIGGIFIGFGTAICCTCCVGIICVGIIIKTRRSGGYTAIGYDASSMNAYNFQPQDYGASQTFGSIGEVSDGLYDEKKSSNTTYGSIDSQEQDNSGIENI